ncbi:MAG: hypothetical protein FJ387_11255, partial [Verrucomicrobia bacterium]|nr:hypothetical protein [Verrucomicrobiota bacterium]
MSATDSNSTPLAHSARRGAPEQTYRDHVANVRRFASKFAREAAAHSEKWREPFQAVVDLAAAYHDLGKLDEIFQDILRRNRANREGFNHVEAGTAHLLKLKQGEAALCCFAHHVGLRSLGEAGRTPLISNTDQGAQFTSPGFVDAVQSAGVEVSMD